MLMLFHKDHKMFKCLFSIVSSKIPNCKSARSLVDPSLVGAFSGHCETSRRSIVTALVTTHHTHLRVGHAGVGDAAEGDKLRQQDPETPHVGLDREPEQRRYQDI